MQDNLAVVFVGMPGAGKSICVDYLTSSGIPSAYFGGITIDEVKNRGLEVNEENERLVREDIRNKEGKGAYAVRILKQVNDYFNKGHKYVVVDGLYSWTEYKIFKESLGNRAIIIAVVCPLKVRHERLASRPVRPMSETDASSRDYAEIEQLEKGGPIANADYYLINDGPVEELTSKLQQLLSKLNIKI